MAVELTRYSRPSPTRARPAVLTVERSHIVNCLLEHQESVRLALLDNGAAWQYAKASAQTPSSPAGALEACRVLRDQRAGLERLLDSLRTESADYDGRPAA